MITFDDVMLDWAVAELLSPRRVGHWHGPACDALRAKVSSGGIGALSPYERSWLIGRIAGIRSPIISAYGPCRSWSFWRDMVSREDLLRFSIIHHFERPSFSFGDFAAEIDPGTSKRRDMGREVMEVAAELSAGKAPLGTPIAAVPGGSTPPVLIEGYTRCMAALRTGQESVELYFTSPEPATVAIGSDAR